MNPLYFGINCLLCPIAIEFLLLLPCFLPHIFLRWSYSCCISAALPNSSVYFLMLQFVLRLYLQLLFDHVSRDPKDSHHNSLARDLAAVGIVFLWPCICKYLYVSKFISNCNYLIYQYQSFFQVHLLEQLTLMSQNGLAVLLGHLSEAVRWRSTNVGFLLQEKPTKYYRHVRYHPVGNYTM